MLPVIVLSVIVAVPELSMPPADTADPPVTMSRSTVRLPVGRTVNTVPSPWPSISAGA